MLPNTINSENNEIIKLVVVKKRATSISKRFTPLIVEQDTINVNI